ncbi:MAG: thioredoxin, partial [Planctomycetes bacterium]|nr:thioredoxin [Planctomycetota bacterium]
MGAALQEITTDSFDSFVKATPVTVVDFSATWCGPCQVLKPTVEQLAGEYAGKVNIGKVDIDQNQDLAVRFGVMSVPTLLFFKGGKQVDSMLGVQ